MSTNKTYVCDRCKKEQTTWMHGWLFLQNAQTTDHWDICSTCRQFFHKFLRMES